jgi:hypothetical protein
MFDAADAVHWSSGAGRDALAIVPAAIHDRLPIRLNARANPVLRSPLRVRRALSDTNALTLIKPSRYVRLWLSAGLSDQHFPRNTPPAYLMISATSHALRGSVSVGYPQGPLYRSRLDARMISYMQPDSQWS